MKITGYTLREAIKIWNLRRDAAFSQFEGSLKVFDGDDDKPSPERVADKIAECEHSIAHLQTAQAYYNQKVSADVLGKSYPLAWIIKRLGGAGRLEKLWRTASKVPSGIDRYGRTTSGNLRSKDAVVAKRTISHEDALKRATESAKYAAALRGAVGIANSREIEIDFLQPDCVSPQD
jgi:hypothetical protein